MKLIPEYQAKLIAKDKEIARLKVELRSANLRALEAEEALEDEREEAEREAQAARRAALTEHRYARDYMRARNPWGLTLQRMHILLSLLRHTDGCTYAEIFGEIYGEDAANWPSYKTLTVQMSHIRKALSDRGLPGATENKRGAGYVVTESARPALVEAIGFDPALCVDTPNDEEHCA